MQVNVDQTAGFQGLGINNVFFFPTKEIMLN